MVITIDNLLPLDAELKEQFQKLFGRSKKHHRFSQTGRRDGARRNAMVS